MVGFADYQKVPPFRREDRKPKQLPKDNKVVCPFGFSDPPHDKFYWDGGACGFCGAKK